MATTTYTDPGAFARDRLAFWQAQEAACREVGNDEAAATCRRWADYWAQPATERAPADTRLSAEEWRETESATRMIGIVLLWMLAVMAGALVLAVLP